MLSINNNFYTNNRQTFKSINRSQAPKKETREKLSDVVISTAIGAGVGFCILSELETWSFGKTFKKAEYIIATTLGAIIGLGLGFLGKSNSKNNNKK